MSIESITPATEQGGFVHIDPRALVVGSNVRLDTRLDSDFVDSIRERGVLQAITAYRDDEYRLVVLYGQRRTLGAIEAGRTTVPVMIVARPDEPDRLGDQVVENDHRAGLRAAERVAAFEQMAAFGVTAGQIAKRTGAKKAEVATALIVAASPLAKGAVQRYDFLDLHKAAVVAEFADDPDAVKQLIVTAQQGRGFDHLAQRLRDARTDAAKRAAIEAELTAAGQTVVAEPGWSDPKVRRLSQLVTAEGEDLDDEEHRSCPGRAVMVAKSWYNVEIADDAPSQATEGGEPDADQDARPDEDRDDDLYDDEEDEDEGPRMERVYDWVVHEVCTDFPQYGHRERYRSHDAGSRDAVAEMSDADRQAKREAAAAQRRDVIQANKDWLSATTVRREWLRTFLTRKAAPKSAAEFIAGSLARASHELTEALTYGHRLTRELLSLTTDDGNYYGRGATVITEAVDKAAPARAELLALGMVLAAYEERLKDKSAWRGAGADTVRYLRYLQNNGYELSAIELRACGETTPAADPEAPAADAGMGIRQEVC